MLSVVAHELGHVLGLGHADDEHDVMGETLPAGVRRLALPQFDGRDDLFSPGFLSSRSAADRDGDAAWEWALGQWSDFSGQDPKDVGHAFAERGARGRGELEEALQELSDAALLAWADDDEHDETQVLVGLRRDDEHEHSEFIDSVFEASDDWGLASSAWQTEDRPHRGGQR